MSDIAKRETNLMPDNFYQSVAGILEEARKRATTAVNLSMVHAYFEVGHMIVEEEQHGRDRAEYGKRVLEGLSAYLTVHFGKGFSVENLTRMRKFYLVYSADEISSTALTKFDGLPASSTGRRFYLSWSHYIKLMRIRNRDERHFYEIEAVRNNWSLAELNRQYDSSLYERLALSRDKDKVRALAEEGQRTEKPIDVVKDPYVLEFLGLPEQASYPERDLETRIIDNLQRFLLELGRGFLFAGRQVRFTFDEDHFFVDLVFYNRLLRCFVLFDLKTAKLTHQDLGQMQMYVHYYDRYVKQDDESPTIGILLCKEKNDSVVNLTLPEGENIFASKYETVLPSKEELKDLLNKSQEEYELIESNAASADLEE